MSWSKNPKISVLKVSGQGDVTLSKEAQEVHALSGEQALLEVTFPECIILLPQAQLMADLKARTNLGFERRPRTFEEWKAEMRIRSQRLKSKLSRSEAGKS